MFATAIVVFVVFVVAAYVWDERKLRAKATAELLGVIYSGQWARYGAALKELKRRGENLAEFEPRFRSLLLSPKKVERANAYNLITDYYPATKARLKGYVSLEAPEISRAKLPEVFADVPPYGHAEVRIVG